MKSTFPVLGRVVFSAFVIAIAALEVAGPYKITLTTFALIVLALVPWVAPWLDSIRVGDFEAKFRELRSEVDATRQEVVETRKEIDSLKAAYQAMDADYLAACAEFDPEAPAATLNELGSRLKALARGLRSIDFLFQDIASEKDQGRVFGAACALHVRPQFEAMGDVARLIDKLAADPNLLNFRLKTVYRLLMAVDEIVKLNQRNKGALLNAENKEAVRRALDRLRGHPRCAPDDTGEYCERLIRKLAALGDA